MAAKLLSYLSVLLHLQSVNRLEFSLNAIVKSARSFPGRWD